MFIARDGRKVHVQDPEVDTADPLCGTVIYGRFEWSLSKVDKKDVCLHCWNRVAHRATYYNMVTKRISST